MNNYVQELRKKRFLFLRRIYDELDGSETNHVNALEIGKELGFTSGETVNMYEYLEGEYLIKTVAFGGLAKITHNGIVQVEDAIANPEQETQYFPPVNVIYVQEMTNSQIQQGTVQSTQTITYSVNDLQSIAKFIEEFKTKLPELQLDKDTAQEANAEIATIEAQVHSPKPKRNIIKECLDSLKSILGFVESKAEDIAAKALAEYLISLIPPAGG